MTFNDYQQQALKTESPVTEEVLERFRKVNPIVHEMMSTGDVDSSLMCLANDLKRFWKRECQRMRLNFQ
jgi:hypothetical protein